MQAIILAAGRGTRMGPLTHKTPKPMLKIKNKPILEHTISALPEEVDEVIIVVHYLKDVIKNYFGENYNGKKIKYVEQKKLSGSGKALWACQKHLEEKFLVLMADDLYHPNDLKKIAKHDLAMLAYKFKGDASKFGVIKTDKKKNLKKLVEKPQGARNQLVSVGVHILTKKIFDYPLVKMDGKSETYLSDTIFLMSRDFPIKIIPASLWHPVGYPEDLEKAEKIIHKFSK